MKEYNKEYNITLKHKNFSNFKHRDGFCQTREFTQKEWFDLYQKIKQERDNFEKALQEIANASHFDNIGNWARNKAKQILEDLK